tara:strand:+ start:4905 stop:5234 length:330 start_codon:yes stop_codon:yes gene_type:complete
MKKDLNYESVGEYFEDELGTLMDKYIMETSKYQYVNEDGELFFEDNDRMDRYYETALANLIYLLKKTYNSPKLACKTTGKVINNPDYVEDKEKEVFQNFGQGYLYRITN